MNNHIAEICAELALYHILVGIDEILEHYGTEESITAVEGELWRFLQRIQASAAIAAL